MKTVLFCLLTALPLAAQTSLTANLPAQVYPGPTYTGTISLACPGANCDGLQWSMTLPPGITIPSSQQGVVFTSQPGAVASTASKTVSCATAPLLLTCVVVGMNSTLMGSGVVAQFNFQVAPGTATGPLALSFSNVVAADASGASVAITAPAAASVAVIPSPCDLNQDGRLDSSDFGLLLNRVLGISVPQGTQACDVNGDSACDVRDLIALGHAISVQACVLK
jgi:hypothetical protein